MTESANERPVLRYVEVHAADHCNLNCKACSHFSPLFPGGVFPNSSRIKKDFIQLRRLFSSIMTIRVLGGEPLLNPDLPLLLVFIRELFPESRIAVVSNGILLKKTAELLTQCMRDNHIQMHVTHYPVEPELRQTIREGIRLFREQQVEVIESPLMDRFRLFLTEYPVKEDSFLRCNVRGCNLVRNGRIYSCAMSAMISQYNKVFEKSFPENDGICLETAEAGCDVLQALNQKCGLCAYCYDSDRLVRWERTGNYRAEDWLMERNEGNYGG